MRLGPEEGRIIGCLVEKQLTTPQQYPLTLNAVVSACNQSSNRDPVVRYDERTVQQALRSLKNEDLVHFVYPSHGRSVIRYQQALGERLALDEPTLALLAVLLLRGPQTAGELRARVERMAGLDGIAAVEAALERMTEGPDPLVQRLPRRPGQKEERWTQLLTPAGLARAAGEAPAAGDGGAPAGDGRAPAGDGGAPAGDGRAPAGAYPAASDTRVSGVDSATNPDGQASDLFNEVAALRAEVAALRAAVGRLSPQSESS